MDFLWEAKCPFILLAELNVFSHCWQAKVPDTVAVAAESAEGGTGETTGADCAVETGVTSEIGSTMGEDWEPAVFAAPGVLLLLLLCNTISVPKEIIQSSEVATNNKC